MKKIVFLLSVISLFLVFSCGEPNSSKDSKTSQSESYKDSEEDIDVKEVVDRKLIKEGNIRFETVDLSVTRKNILKAVKNYNGYIASDKEYHDDGEISNNIVIRVPSKNFDKLLSDISDGVSYFDNKQIDVLDVTEEYFDSEARLKAKKEIEARYLELLKEAKNVNEMLEVEEQLGILRTEIERIEGHMKYLNDRVAYSTLSISFYQIIPNNKKNNNKYGRKFYNGFNQGWEGFIQFLVVLTSAWVFIVAGLLLYIIYRIRRKKGKKNRAKQEVLTTKEEQE